MTRSNMGDTQNLINSSLNLDQFPLEESILIPESGGFIPDQDREEIVDEDGEMSTGEILLRRYSQDDSSDDQANRGSDEDADDADEHGVYSEIDTDDLLDRIQARQRLEQLDNEQAAGTGTSNTEELVERILTRNETVTVLPNTPDIEELLDYPSNENNA
jgi:hypothetical protein